MKAGIHPQYHQAKVICACGNTFTVGSTQDTIRVELCSNCHPFYTGEERFVDTASKIDKFNKQRDLASQIKATMHAQKIEKQKKDNAPKTLAEMLAAAK